MIPDVDGRDASETASGSSSGATNTAMIKRFKPFWTSMVLLTVFLNAGILFFAIPEFSKRMHQLYNQDEYADGYDQLATNLADGNGYRMYPDTAPTMVREPGYPILLAGLYILFGKDFVAVKFTNMLLAFATAWLMTRIATKLSSNRLLILVPPFLFLFHPGVLIAESRGGVEVLFTFLLTLYVWSLYRALESDRWRNSVISGAVLGLTVLVKSTPMLFPAFLLGYLLVFEPRRPKRMLFLNISSMVLAMLVVLSPWIIRNYAITGKFIPTATVLGVSAHAGQYVNSHLPADGSWALTDRQAARERRKIAEQLGYRFKNVDNAYYQDFYSSGDEVKFSNYLFKSVMAEYERSPMLFVRCVGSNFFNLWFRGKTWDSTMTNVVVQTPYLILALLGTVLVMRSGQGKAIGVLLVLLIYSVAVYVVILAQARYSVPLLPLLSILAGFCFVRGQVVVHGVAPGGWREVELTLP